ncbi:inosine-uridine preferring nucleoside hydrolase-like isoform x1 [Plakobranchus ocellatus]|uniref:Inosine-uridine preferring nucleoside hydrolase-like isoform x1 n=1 Tax=Plakobranchus ocellatus TaxID=259542 RepID=A0AAV3YBF4_9GAST|nr:inosine-uridine preferring nucleoside hydrolase-like isoform x1 [Plakobranchus ocellatus]
MPLRMEPGQIYNTWADFKEALDAHCEQNKCLFNISNAKTVEQANRALKKRPFFDIRLKYASCILVCKHYGSYTSLGTGLRPKQKTYKTNCKAYINVSACRKENYLIIRDSYHLHSHPCTDEMYYSYPEVRRMTKDERKIVGTLMELGVPTAQIKTAVGPHVTPKDLQNAKTHFKAAKLSLKSNELQGASKGNEPTLEYDDNGEIVAKVLSQNEDGAESEVGKESFPSTSYQNKALREVVSFDTGDSGSYIISVDNLQETLSVGATENDGLISEESRGCKADASAVDASGLSGLLAAAGINPDSIVVTMNNQSQVNEGEIDSTGTNSAYTVTLCLPDGDVSKKGNNLQELLKGLPLGKIISKPSANVTLQSKLQPLEEKEAPLENHKLCSICEGYISPLDGHDQCLSCLGPEHIQEEDCEHCKAMAPKQFNIRRKKMVALRMKALKALQKKRKLEEEQKQEENIQNVNEAMDAESDFTANEQRKSKRIRKPKSFGPDVSVETFVGKRKSGSVSSESTHSHLEGVIKTEPFYDHEDSVNIFENVKSDPQSSERFAHVLSQTAIFDDVTCTAHSNGSLTYKPEQNVSRDFQRLMNIPDLPAIPPTIQNKYRLDTSFESKFCSSPEPLKESLEPSLDAMNKGLCKLATNAASNARLAMYDKLFTRLGVSMADEALSILTELYGKVTQVTEISQEDLTSNLQTAVDTIQALKDVLEELGVMSKDAALTAAYQRSISLNSLSKARSSLTSKITPRDNSFPRRVKFIPFSSKKLCTNSHLLESSPEHASLTQETSFSPEEMEVPSTTLPLVSSVGSTSSSFTEANSSSEIVVAGPQSTIEVTTEPEPNFINVANKIYSVTPMTISSELLQTLSSP